jgi:hypothetical protein
MSKLEDTTMASHALAIIEPDAPMALDLPAGLTFEQWEAEGRRLSFTSHALQWYIGDWWNAGHRFGEERRAETAKRLFGLEYGTVRNYGSVAGKFEPSQRRDALSFSHHMELAGLDDRAKIDELARKVEEQGLSQRALRAEVAAMRGDNVVVMPRREVQKRLPLPEPEPVPVPRNELTEAHSRYVEAMEALQEYRDLTRREADYLAFVYDQLGEAFAERREVPDEFEVVFVEQGRLACEPYFGASRITVNRGLIQKGKKRLIDKRADFVKHQRNMAKSQMPLHADDPQPEFDQLLPVARQAAQHLRISRYGGYKVSQCDAGGWFVGTVRRSSEELVVMAERVGFDRAAAAAEAEREGY